MGKLKLFVIELENPQGVYFAGQPVNGRVIIQLDAAMKMREVRLTFKGLAYVHWSESHTTGSGKNRHTTTRHYSATENYFHHVVPLYGRGLGTGDDNQLPPGQHMYPFTFNLPNNLPSSFEGGIGYVRYTIKATIDKPWKFDHDTKRPFTVIALLDLNLQQNAMCATHNQDTKFLCCLCCKSGPINGLLRLDRMGYVPGEGIFFNAEIQNLSDRICGTHVKLYQVITFHATTKSRSSTREITRVVHGDVQPGETENWTGDRLVIPPVPPSFLIGCSIIDIRYYLELIVDPSGPAIDLHVPLEIIIGTIPLHSVVQQYQQSVITQQPVMSAPPIPQTDATGGPPHLPQAGATGGPPPNMPPPSYSECVFGKVNIKDDEDTDHTNGDMNYAPAYTYYDWSSSALR